MQASPTNVVFPSSSDEELRNSPSKPEAISIGQASDTRKLGRRPVQSGRRMIPITKGNADAHRIQNFHATRSVLIGSKHTTCVPPIEYYTRRPLLKIPEHSRPQSPGNKALKKINPAVLSPDQVSQVSVVCVILLLCCFLIKTDCFVFCFTKIN